jgi:hypothetical protein
MTDPTNPASAQGETPIPSPAEIVERLRSTAIDLRLDEETQLAALVDNAADHIERIERERDEWEELASMKFHNRLAAAEARAEKAERALGVFLRSGGNAARVARLETLLQELDDALVDARDLRSHGASDQALINTLLQKIRAAKPGDT